MKKQNIAMVLSAGAVIAVICSCAVASAQEGILLRTDDGIELWSVPQPDPSPGLLATKIVFRSVDPALTDIVTYDGLQITGSLHQVAFPNRNPTPTPSLQSYEDEGGFFDAWLPYDSKILFTRGDIGGGAGGGFAGLQETNDRSDPVGANALIPLVPGEDAPAITGIGGINVSLISDAFFTNASHEPRCGGAGLLGRSCRHGQRRRIRRGVAQSCIAR